MCRTLCVCAYFILFFDISAGICDYCRMENEPQELKLPFKEELPQARRMRRGIFFDVPGHPDVLARTCRGYEDAEFFYNGVENYKKEHLGSSDADARAFSEKQFLERMIKNASEFRELMEQFGFPVVPVRYMIAEKPNTFPSSNTIWAVIDRIDGKDLDDIGTFDEKISAELDDIYVKFFTHLKNAYETNTRFWSDFFNGQMMYGKLKEESEPHIRIADIDPILMDFSDPEFKGRTAADIFWMRCYRCFRNVAEALEKGAKLPDTLNAIQDLYRDIPEPSCYESVSAYNRIKRELKK